MTYFTALMTVMRKSRNVFATASAPRLRPSPLPWHPDQLFREHAEAIGRRDGSMTGGNRGGRGGRGGQGAATFLSPLPVAPEARMLWQGGCRCETRELLLLYWQLGREILLAQRAEAWGTKVVERLAKDLAAEFPEMSGFSRANLLRMRVDRAGKM